jgi:hypothetical protein
MNTITPEMIAAFRRTHLAACITASYHEGVTFICFTTGNRLVREATIARGAKIC